MATATVANSSVDVRRKSFSRLSLITRRSSRATSEHDAVANENGIIQPPSSGDSPPIQARRSSLAKLSARLLRAKTDRSNVQHKTNEIMDQNAPFLSLPPEIHVQILSYVTKEDLYNLRRVSRSAVLVIQYNSVSISRNLLHGLDEDIAYILPQSATSSTPPATSLQHLYMTSLYPVLTSATSSQSYLLQTLHRHSLLTHCLPILLKHLQTRAYMRRLTSSLPHHHFGPYKPGLVKILYRPLLVANHFLETLRAHILYTHSCACVLSLEATCPTCTTTITTLLSRTVYLYATDLLVPLHHTLALMHSRLLTALQRPSLISTVLERRLASKGWTTAEPPPAYIAQFMFLGGTEVTNTLDEMVGDYGKRVSVVTEFVKRIKGVVGANEGGMKFAEFNTTRRESVATIASSQSGSASGSGGNESTNGLGESEVLNSTNLPRERLTKQRVESLPHPGQFLRDSTGIIAQEVRRRLEVDGSLKPWREEDWDLNATYVWLTDMMRVSLKIEGEDADEEEVEEEGDEDEDEDEDESDSDS